MLINTTLLDDIKEVKDKIKAKEEVLTTEELRELDPSYKALKRELAELEAAKEEMTEKMKSLKPKIADLKVTARKWIKDRKEVREEAFHNEINKIKRYKESLNVLKAEYQKVLNKYYNEPLKKQVEIDKKSLEEAIKYHESEIERLEKEVREGMHKINGFSNKVTVKFVTRGGSREGVSYDPIEIEKGSLITPPENPILDDDNEFECWTLNGEPFDFTQPVNENITLEAKYRGITRHHVTFCDEKGNELNTISIKEGESLGANLRNLDDKKFKEFEGWVKEDGTLMSSNEPVNEPLILTAKYKRNWKKIAAIGAGVAMGAVTLGADMLLATGGLISNATTAAMGIAAGITQFKLKNHKTELKPTENLKSIRKASAKLVNYFRDNKNIKNLRTFFATATVSTLVTGVGLRVANAFGGENLAPTGGEELHGEEITNTGDNLVTQTTNNTTTNSVENPETIQGYFEKAGTPDKIYDTAFESQGLFNAENPLPEFDGSMPTKAYNTATGQWMNIDKTTTLKQLTQTLGTDDPQILYTKNGVDMGWESLKSLVGGMSR